VTQVVSATIAKRNRQAALEDKLRDAVSEILVLQNRFELAQKNFFVASSDYWDGGDKQTALPPFYAAREEYYSLCDEAQRAITTVRPLKNDKRINGALTELGAIASREQREDPAKFGKADDGVDSNRALQDRTKTVFDNLEEAARNFLTG
jgi:hypothetical protein